MKIAPRVSNGLKSVATRSVVPTELHVGVRGELTNTEINCRLVLVLASKGYASSSLGLQNRVSLVSAPNGA